MRTTLSRFLHRASEIAVDLFIGDPRDHHWSNPGFLNFLVPLALGIGGSIFKKKSADSAAKKAQAQQQAEMDREFQQRRAQFDAYNNERTSSVNRRRELLKAAILNKGWNTSKLWDSLGGFDQFFSRPVSGLKDPSLLGMPGQAPRADTGGWGNFLGDALGAGASMAGNYFTQRQQASDFDKAAGATGYSPQDLARLKLGAMLGGGRS